ncbi:MAG TPA: MltA domain-containing protein [Patescibacteria group bacterium]|nr:MltA domain-containing protein [Patescibacteria group bacterium]
MTATSRRSLSVLAGLLLLAGCSSAPTLKQGAPSAPPPPSVGSGEDRLYTTPVSFNDLPGWGDDALAQAIPALRRSCEKITHMPSGQLVGNDGQGGVAGDWMAPCGALRSVAAGDHAAARVFFESWFQPYRVSGGARPDGLFTGYYQAELHGSRRPGGRYLTPLYARPAGLAADPSLNGTPYFTRAEIEAGALRGKASELLWVDDAVDAHILHIQGSGRVTMDDGTVVQVGFNGSNGHKFVGLGSILARHGKLAAGETNMPSIRSWLKTHPAEAPGLMSENPRYVFFRLIEGDGPIGAQGVALTAGRSMAVDPRFIPLGVPLWLDSTDPDGLPMRRLMVAQDTGAAIKGVIRGDVFWGAGEAAFDKAGRMKSRGSYYLLLPRSRSGPVALNSPSARR